MFQQVIQQAPLRFQGRAKREYTQYLRVRHGFLRKEIKGFARREGDSIVIGLRNEKNYAAAQHYGSAPHVIFPVNKKALFWKGAAHPVKRVKHPGTRAKPFLREPLEREADSLAADILKKIEFK